VLCSLGIISLKTRKAASSIHVCFVAILSLNSSDEISSSSHSLGKMSFAARASQYMAIFYSVKSNPQKGMMSIVPSPTIPSQRVSHHQGQIAQI
jgi:hypothetical protein